MKSPDDAPPPSPIANRAARAVVLVGVVALAIWTAAAIVIVVELAANQTSTLSNDAALLIWSIGHIFVGIIAFALCACPIPSSLWLFIAAGIILLVIDIFELVVRAFNLIEVFPAIGFFPFIYLAFNLAFAALAIAYIFFAWRASRRYFGFGSIAGAGNGGNNDMPLFDTNKKSK